jgi:D-3-phosphoglycerate dehydrogenase
VGLPKTYIFDFDSTLVTVESLDELARIALDGRADKAAVMAELEHITQLGMSGDIAFDESLRRRLKLFQATKAHVAKTAHILADNISPTARAHVGWLRAHAPDIYVVSGGFADYIEPVVQELGIRASHVYANRFCYDTDGQIIGYDDRHVLAKPQGKVRQVRELGLAGRHIVMVGDGYTEYEVRQHGASHEFWAFTETIHRPKVTASADRILHSFAEIAIS